MLTAHMVSFTINCHNCHLQICWLQLIYGWTWSGITEVDISSGLCLLFLACHIPSHQITFQTWSVQQIVVCISFWSQLWINSLMQIFNYKSINQHILHHETYNGSKSGVFYVFQFTALSLRQFTVSDLKSVLLIERENEVYNCFNGGFIRRLLE